MIINDSKKICFVHIPKCAGTSIRHLIQEFDDLNGSRIMNHSELGLLDHAHIPLPILHDYFPELYSKVEGYYSFAIIRDPYQRFSSSVAQRLRMYCKKGLKDASNEEIVNEIDSCINFLNDNSESVLLPAEYIHFQRQSSYVFNGEQVVNNLYLIDEFDRCLSDIANFFDLKVNDDVNKDLHLNKSMVYRSGLFAKLQPWLFPVIKPLIPSSVIIKLRKLIYVPKKTNMEEMFATEKVKSFIQSYYKEDIKLFNSLKKKHKK